MKKSVKYKWSLFIFLGTIVLSSCEKVEDQVVDTSRSEIELSIIELTNQHRSSLNLSALTQNDVLDRYAKEHTEYMINQGEISHDDFSARMDLIISEIGGSSVGENVAYGYSSASEVMTGWLNSEGHRENIEGDYTDIGVSAIKDNNGTYYYTQIFLKK